MFWLILAVDALIVGFAGFAFIVGIAGDQVPPMFILAWVGALCGAIALRQSKQEAAGLVLAVLLGAHSLNTVYPLIQPLVKSMRG